MSGVEMLARQAADGFRTFFGVWPERIAFAPGRVNLIGEHTDYNRGFVLPCAIPFGTAIAAGSRADGRIAAVALDFAGETDDFEPDQALRPVMPDAWANHVRGMAAALMRSGTHVAGTNLAIAGNVPVGAGLSSSASLGVALGLALSGHDLAEAPDRLRIARAAQWAENNFAGCACGLMDQLASAFGIEGKALLIDCADDSIDPVSLPADSSILIVHSGVARGLAGSAYNDRRAQCEAAARHYGVPSLRELDPVRLDAGREGLDDVTFRRARHVVSENVRTLKMASALSRGDFADIGQQMRRSHLSLRDDFAVTVPEVDDLAETMQQALGDAGGARMTGGGFGGCLVAVLHHERLPALEDALARYWRDRCKEAPLQLVVSAAAGARFVHVPPSR
jgi:galactokinase